MSSTSHRFCTWDSTPMNMHYTIFAFLLLSLLSAFSAGFARSLHSSGTLARLGVALGIVQIGTTHPRDVFAVI